MAADFLKTDYLFLAVGVVGGACSDVEQTFVQVTKFSKREQLLDMLKTTGNFFPSVILRFPMFRKKLQNLSKDSNFTNCQYNPSVYIVCHTTGPWSSFFPQTEAPELILRTPQ